MRHTTGPSVRNAVRNAGTTPWRLATLQGMLELPNFEFRSVHDAATVLREEARRARAEKLYMIPFNRYEPHDTYWWLSPRPDNPAYRFGKIVLAAGEGAAPGELFVGLTSEKGVGPSAAPAFITTSRGQGWVMDKTWHWVNALTPALTSGALERASKDAEEQAGIPLCVFIDAAYVDPPREWGDVDVHSDIWPRDVVRFTVSSGRLDLLDVTLKANLLEPLVDAKDFFGLAVALDTVRDNDWVWIDFHIGLRFRKATSDDQEPWPASEVWRRACAPWLGWVR